MTQPKTISLAIDGPIATITLERPERRNSVNAQLTRELSAAVQACEANPQVAVTILTGSGSSFCAGMDLAAFADGETEAILHGKGRFAGFVGVRRTKPVIAAVNGPAMAGGFELVLACDMAVAADTAIFGLPEAKRGLIAGAGGVFRLANRLPIALVNEIILIGAPIDAARACALGLINRVVPAADVMATARDMAGKVAASAPMSVALGLDLARSAASGDESALWSLNDDYLNRTTGSKDAQEGARAFLEKRPPAWRGE
ncbi:crotonase [Antarcticimicrobium luteum]|uniref:Crotonase n=2 Tax=Antarcticimicrobium luteum TaxID=2547397 RepID=A0A4R5V297_9RHOB|nr:crotonase [Antarcticimicrobium luteum]